MADSSRMSAAEMAAAYAAQLEQEAPASQPAATTTTTVTAAEGDPTAAAAAAGWDPVAMMQYMQQYYAMAAAASMGSPTATTAAAAAAATAAAPPLAVPPRSDEGAGPVRYLWVGGLPADATEDELSGVFGAHGRVDGVRILPGRNCAFVRFEDLGAATAAHDSMHGRPLRGGVLRVGWGKSDPFEREDRSSGPVSRVLWVGSVHPETGQDELAMHFQEFGPIESIRIVPHKSCAFVTYATADVARRAKMRANGRVVHGQQIRVNYGRTELNSAPPGAPQAFAPSPAVRMPRPPSIFVDDAAPGPLAPVPPPPAEMQAVIDKFAEYVLRNGRTFEDNARSRQAATPTPKLAFLEPHDPNHAYYRWKISELWAEKKRQIEATMPSSPPRESYHSQQQQQQQQQQHLVSSQPPQQQSMTLSREDRANLVSNLEMLVSTKESIKQMKEWICARPEHMPSIADLINKATDEARDFGKRLSIIYLINDVLHFGLRKRTEGNPAVLDEFASALQTVLPSIVRLAGRSASNEDERNKVTKVFEIWEKRSILPADTMAYLRSLLTAQESIPQPHHFQQAPLQQQQQQQQFQRPSQQYFQPQPPPNPPPPPQQEWYMPPPPPPPEPDPLPTYSDVAQMVGSIRSEVGSWGMQPQQGGEQEWNERPPDGAGWGGQADWDPHDGSYHRHHHHHSKRRHFDEPPPAAAFNEGPDAKRERRW